MHVRLYEWLSTYLFNDNQLRKSNLSREINIQFLKPKGKKKKTKVVLRHTQGVQLQTMARWSEENKLSSKHLFFLFLIKYRRMLCDRTACTIRSIFLQRVNGCSREKTSRRVERYFLFFENKNNSEEYRPLAVERDRATLVEYSTCFKLSGRWLCSIRRNTDSSFSLFNEANNVDAARFSLFGFIGSSLSISQRVCRMFEPFQPFETLRRILFSRR